MRLIHQLGWGWALILGAGVLQAEPGANTIGWKTLFNGTDLSGWVKMNGGVFFATNGVLHLEGSKGWLRTERPFTDFILEAECCGLETNYNSGIFLRAPLDGNPWATNVWQLNLKQTGFGELLEGPRRVETVSAKPRPTGEWVKLRIEVRGHKVSLAVDGQPFWEFQEFTPLNGYLGLQAEGRAVEFRNVRIGELSVVEVPLDRVRPGLRP